VPAQKTPLELPVLRLGTVGFAPAQQALLEAALANLDSGMTWQISKLSHADAWCANGSALEVLPDGSLQIGSGSGEVRPVRINLDESDRPIAFSLPLATQRLRDVTTFHLNSPASIRGILDRFEGWLRPMAVQLCLASYIAEHNLDLNTGVFHVTAKGRLQAVVSRSGVGVLPIADPVEVVDASWAHRPPFADEIPRHFLRIGFPQLMWQYAMRTTRDVLPPRFRTGLIYWRGPPQLPNRLLTDTHLLIARELSQAPATFGELGEHTHVPDTQLARCLAAFYVVGAITTDKRRAADTPADRNATLANLRETFRTTSASLTGDAEHSTGPASDATAPAPFNPHLP
jgi:hypothetical protein